METQLVEIVKTSGIEISEGQTIIDTFSVYFKNAKEWEEKSRSIIVTDVSDIEQMKLAKEGRIILKKIRIDSENARKDFKDGYLKKGKAIDMIAKLVSSTIEPIEEYLENQEKYVINAEKDRLDIIGKNRELELQKYVPDVSMYNLREMNDEAYYKIVEMSRKIFEDAQEAERIRENLLKEEEKKKEEENERIKIENEQLKKEKEERDQLEKIEHEEREKKELEEKIRQEKEKEERDRQIAEEKEKQDALLAQERETKEKLKAELEQKRQEDEKNRMDAEAKLRAEQEALRLKELEPDKDKLIEFSEMIKSIKIPKVTSPEAQAIVLNIESSLLELSQSIKVKVQNL